MIIICGKTVAEVERDLEMAKLAIASGAPMGIGGATVEDVEQALAMMKQMGVPAPATITNPNYDPCYGCPHWKPNNECEIGYDCEEETECPICGATYPEWDGEHCENCGYGYEDAEEDEEEEQYVEELIASAERLGIPLDEIHSWISDWLQ